MICACDRSLFYHSFWCSCPLASGRTACAAARGRLSCLDVSVCKQVRLFLPNREGLEFTHGHTFFFLATFFLGNISFFSILYVRSKQEPLSKVQSSLVTQTSGSMVLPASSLKITIKLEERSFNSISNSNVANYIQKASW